MNDRVKVLRGKDINQDLPSQGAAVHVGRLGDIFFDPLAPDQGLRASNGVTPGGVTLGGSPFAKTWTYYPGDWHNTNPETVNWPHGKDMLWIDSNGAHDKRITITLPGGSYKIPGKIYWLKLTLNNSSNIYFTIDPDDGNSSIVDGWGHTLDLVPANPPSYNGSCVLGLMYLDTNPAGSDGNTDPTWTVVTGSYQQPQI